MDEQTPLQYIDRPHAAQQSEHAVVVDLSSQGGRGLHQKEFPMIITAVSDVSPSEFERLDVSGNGSCSAECRICQEEEDTGELDNPCACSGSLKFAHRKCVQRWCNEKGDTTCEICQQPFKSGYTAPPRPAQLLSDEISIDFSDDPWNTRSIELNDLRQLLAVPAAQRRLVEEADSEQASSSSADCCRSVAFIMLALLLLRHAVTLANASANENASMFFTFFVLRAAGFLLPFYIIGQLMNTLQSRQQTQDATVAATEVAIFLQARRMQRFSISPRQSQAGN